MSVLFYYCLFNIIYIYVLGNHFSFSLKKAVRIFFSFGHFET